MQRDFLGESHPPTGERPEGVLGGRDGRVDGARSESGAAREQAVIGEIVEGFSQDGRGLHDDLLQRVHRRGARFHGGIPCDLELADHLDGAVRGLGDGRRLPREQGPRRHLGVDGVGLAGGAACTAVAPIHFHDMMPGSVDGPCQASALVHNSRSRSIIALHPEIRGPGSRMTSFKRTQRKYVQKAYRVRNWREYETGLRARGSLTVWLGLTDGKLANWNSPRPTRRKPGRQRKYSNHAIETTVTLGLVFGLASRQTEGFLRSLLTLLNLDNDVPDHSTISRRKARLGKVASYERRTVKPVHLLIDSSGLSVHVGQLRTPPKARDYRKLHLAVDEQTSDVVACELTSTRARDASRVASLVGQIERPIASAKADAAYDTGDVYKTLENHRAHRSPKVLIPPRKGAQLALDSAGTRQRNRNIRARSRVGKRKWYVASGYSRRSKVETTFHRYKAILGSAMRARGLASQRVEVRLGCKILNTMTALGIPDGEMIG